MKILVINCGSSSLKYQLIDMVTKNPIGKGLVERIGLQGSVLTHRTGSGEKVVIKDEISNHTVAIKLVLEALVSPEYGAVQDLKEISAIGHRVVHGGEKFSTSVIIDDAVMEALKDCIELAPLHNPPNIAGIKACQKMMPGVPQVAVFDTAFHQTMQPDSYIYGLPYEYYEKYGIRKYGFHGTSHKYVSQRAAILLRKPLEELKLISCHLGNGASITAIKGGKSIETSMGFTPLDGLMMGTRSGTLDPAIVTYIQCRENYNCEQINDFLNNKCGALGVSGVSSDFRDIEVAAAQGNYRAKLALDIFEHDVKLFVGSYAAIMGGVDAIIFTAGVGENAPNTRAGICSNMDYLGISLDLEKNKVRSEEVDVSKADSRCRVLVIPTNEELMIALETLELTQ
ncbi:acetate kinase [Desulfosporosinus sp. Sb-LF]|uniref:acetate/propionate family kinase n=1 Tax=Desulfosporosinus sp. Sb-LF TaxID=2560027 RepID=UPI00107FBFA1|nr:acetate kinase [Desulfosporosinus sp. Sb-LF]TGE32757.1 acetate kinase [Desulfosporosinus sp. Sb-LF]